MNVEIWVERKMIGTRIGFQLSPSGQSLVDEKENMIVRKIFSGGDQSFVSAVGSVRQLDPLDCRNWK